MESTFYAGNRQRLAAMMENDSLLIVFSGEEVRKTNDEFYPFFAHRSFVYLTGIEQKQSVLVIEKNTSGDVTERIYLLPSDLMAERWTGRRLTADEAFALSGCMDVRPVTAFENDLRTRLAGGHYSAQVAPPRRVYLDLYKAAYTDRDTPAHQFLDCLKKNHPYVAVGNADLLIRRLRLIKQPCEIAALREAERITGEGIIAMMKASRPGLYEYQYKAAFDHALGQYGPEQHGFPPIISAGRNNFCIHYYAYTGRAEDGDMILNDVGAQWDHMTADVSRGFPCNGHFSARQRLLYSCMLATSDHMFSIVRPGMKMSFIDQEIKRFCGEKLVEAGALAPDEPVTKLMWHGGSHHIGFDVHDVVDTPELIAPGMCFCIDVGVYHEEWGIGFRL